MQADDELEAIRRRKMQELLKRAQAPKAPPVLEPMANGIVNQLDSSTFWPTIQKTKTAIIDFYGEWCQPCKMIAPLLAELAVAYKGKVFFGKVDIDRNPGLANQFRVQSVPNVLAFKNGRFVNNMIGARRYSEYDAWVTRMIAEYGQT